MIRPRIFPSLLVATVAGLGGVRPVAAQQAAVVETPAESPIAAFGTDLTLDPSSVRLGAFQDGTVPSPPGTDGPTDGGSEWRFDLFAAAWVPVKVKGDFTLAGTKTVVNLDLDDILDALDGIFEGGFNFTNDEWSILFFGLWVKLGADATTRSLLGEIDTNLDFELAILDVAVGRRLGNWSLGDSDTATWGVDLLGGLRYWSLDTEVTVRGSVGILDVNAEESDNWVDPFVGARLLFHFSDKVSLALRADIGGFSIGSAADLSWQLAALGKFKLSDNVDLLAGYRYVDVDWDRGSSTEYDFYLHGPIIGVSIVF
jgi:opacity protein-like surface antigen